ncbi:MAG: hypothetical protein AABW87_00120, partial [Nanoarchaeota archaeon]
ISPQISASNDLARVSIRVSRDGGKTFSGRAHVLHPEVQFGEQTFKLDVTNDFDQIVNGQLIEKPWYYENLTKLVVKVGCYKFGSGNNPTCKLDYIPATVKFTDFSFSSLLNTSSVTIVQGSSASALATLTLTGGLPSEIMPEISDCPASATCSFSPASGKPSFTSTFTIKTSPLTPLGNYYTYLARSNPAYPNSDPKSGAVRLAVTVIPSPNARITDACSLTDTLFRVSGQTGGLASQFDYQDYPYKVCYPEAGPISRLCTSQQDPSAVFELFQINKTNNKVYTPDSMVYQFAQSDFIQVCSSNVGCYYDTSCSPDYTCLFSLTNKLEGSVGECGTYPLKACCSLRDFYPNDPCSKAALNDWCGTGECVTDSDGDGAFTDATGAYGCDGFPADSCSISALNDNCPQECTINNARWAAAGSPGSQLNSTVEGTSVRLIVETSLGCIGAAPNFTVYEIDIVGRDNVSINPPLGFFTKDGGPDEIWFSTTWTAEYQADISG